MDNKNNVNETPNSEETTEEIIKEVTTQEVPKQEQENPLQPITIEFEYEDVIEKGLLVDSVQEIYDGLLISKRIVPIVHDEGVFVPIIINIPSGEPQMLFYNVDKDIIKEIIHKFLSGCTTT